MLWTTTSRGLAAFAFVLLSLGPALVHAHQAPDDDDELHIAAPPPPPSEVPSTHPRAARALSLEGDRAVVLVANDRAWDPMGGQALSVCTAQRCAPVRTVETCTVPRCPGSGALLLLAASIASVGDFPTGREDFQRAQQDLLGDPSLAALGSYFAGHPDPPPQPARFATEREDIRWELSLDAGGGYFVEAAAPVAMVTASGGFRFRWDSDRGGDDEVLAILWGNSLGLDLRVRALLEVPRLDANGTTTAVTIGIAPVPGYAFEDDVVRIPTAYSFVVPEVGIAVREDFDPTWYVAWNLPVAVLLDEHVALEARATLMLIGDWPQREDTLEGFVGGSAALLFR